MSNEQTETEASQEQVKGQSEKKAVSVIEKAEQIAARIEIANQKAEDLLDRQEALEAREMLGGNSNAGQKVEPKQVQTPSEYVNSIESGELQLE